MRKPRKTPIAKPKAKKVAKVKAKKAAPPAKPKAAKPIPRKPRTSPKSGWAKKSAKATLKRRIKEDADSQLALARDFVEKATVFKAHPLAEVFPLIQGAEFDALVEDIRANGLQHPIILHEGMILDGRNRYRACIAAGVPLRFDVFAGADPIAYVVSTNLRRRDLNASQRAFAIAELEKYGHGGKRRGDDDGANGGTKNRKQLAGEGKVSERQVARGAVVREHGAEPLKQAVRAGTVSVDKAAQLALLPADEQADIVARGEKEIVAKAKEIRAGKMRKRHAARIEKMGRIAQNNGPLPADQTFAVIYADPPWKYETWSDETGGEHAAPYPTMTLDEIAAIDVGSIVAVPAILFLWVDRQHHYEAKERLAQAWGPIVVDDPVYGPIRQPWTYRYDYIWDKELIGRGFGNRDQHEHLLAFTIGDVPMPLPELRAPSVYRERRGEHSDKPSYFRDLINAQYGTLPKIELFAREAAPGWAVWGNQAPAEADPADDLFVRLYANAEGLVELFEDHNGRGKVLSAAATMDQNMRVAHMRAVPGPLLAAIFAGEALPAEILDFLAEAKLVRGRKAPKLTSRGEDALDEWREEEARRAELAALPDDIEELIAQYGRALALRHADILGAYVDDVARGDRKLDLLQMKANGDTDFGMACDDSPAERLRRENAAAPGVEPMWNQIGLFRLDIDGTPYIVSHDDSGHIGVYAEDATKPFCSETGYQSFVGADIEGPALGCTVAHQAEVYIREAIAATSGSDGKRKPRTKKTAMQLPEVVYRIPASWSDYSDDERFGEPIRGGGEHPWECERREAEEKKAATRERKAQGEALIALLDRYARNETLAEADHAQLFAGKLILGNGVYGLTPIGEKRLASWRATQEKRAVRAAKAAASAPAPAPADDPLAGLSEQELRAAEVAAELKACEPGLPAAELAPPENIDTTDVGGIPAFLRRPKPAPASDEAA